MVKLSFQTFKLHFAFAQVTSILNSPISVGEKSSWN